MDLCLLKRLDEVSARYYSLVLSELCVSYCYFICISRDDKMLQLLTTFLISRESF